MLFDPCPPFLSEYECLVTRIQVRRIFGCSPRMLEALIKGGCLPPVVFRYGGVPYWRLDDILDYLDRLARDLQSMKP